MVGPPTLQAYLFTDLVDSTALKERLGDVVGAEMIERHDIVFRRCLRENGGIEQHVRSIDNEPVEWRCQGLYRMKGAERPVEIFEGGLVGIAPFEPPPGSAKAHRIGDKATATKSARSRRGQTVAVPSSRACSKWCRRGRGTGR